MGNRAAAARYARALFEVAVKERNLPAVGRGLSGFVALLRSHAVLERVLLSPAVPAPRKRAAVSALVEDRAELPVVVARLLTLLAERGRLVLLPEILAAYQAHVMDHDRIVRAEVTTAVPLPADRRDALERRLAETTGRRVTLGARVDPAIIGGVVARIGSMVLDGSVARQLERMKVRLAIGEPGG